MSTPYKIKKPSNFVLGLSSYYLELIKTRGFSVAVSDILAGLCFNPTPYQGSIYTISLCFMVSKFILTQMCLLDFKYITRFSYFD
jgi:hypothetical protein